jgi:hypothetical protein
MRGLLDGTGIDSCEGSDAMTGQIVTVFGGTGFLGRRIVHHLPGHGLAARIASRHPELVGERAA